jgi:hypothetical protein
MPDDLVRSTADARSDRLGMSPENRRDDRVNPPGTLEEREGQIEGSAIGGGFALETICGIGAVLLAVLGLVGVMPSLFARIATIAVGVGLIAEWAAMSARYARIVAELKPAHLADIDFGASAEFVGGFVGVVLGILTVLGVAPLALICCSLMVFGSAMIVGSNGTRNFRRVLAADSEDTNGRIPMTAFQSVGLEAGTRILIGAGVLALGILGLVESGTPVGASFVEVGLVSSGFAIFLSGTAIAVRPRGARKEVHDYRKVA